MPEIIVIAHNIRSTHNVGAIFRTCEGFGITKLILSGYTPYPKFVNDTRLPHIAAKLTDQIHKTALGAENMVTFDFYEHPPFDTLKQQGWRIVGLEQDARAVALADYRPTEKIVLVLGEEIAGLNAPLREKCDDLIEIPMQGHKESFNVSVATGIALYALLHN